MIVHGDLRIGNRFAKSENDVQYRLEAVEYNNATGKLMAKIQPVKDPEALAIFVFVGDLRPVPLTDELLLIYGFEKRYLLEDEPPVFSKDVVLICDSFEEDRFFFDTGMEIKYVHQLQSLYFALTGKELIR